MIIVRIGQGKVRHVVEFRPDLTPRWRSVCHLAAGEPGTLTYSKGMRGCKRCIEMLENGLTALKEAS